MRKGFTLLELIVVIIILGVLATLGIQQYFRIVEKSRSAEAKQILGQLREAAAGFYTEQNTCTGLGPASGGTLWGIAPTACAGLNYFTYSFQAGTPTGVTLWAQRCTSGGKSPDGAVDDTIQLTTDFAAGTDVWAYGNAYQ